MAFVNIKQRSVTNWEPADYTSNETTAVMPVHAGEMIVAAFVRIREAFDGTNTNATIALGTGDDPDGLIATGDATWTSTGLAQGSGAKLADDFGWLITTDDTVDIAFVADTAGDGTTGIVDVWIYYVTVEPH